MSKVLLDTHVFLWYISGELDKKTRATIESCIENHGRLYVSAISIWEIAMLEARQRIYLNMPCLEWVQLALNQAHVVLAELTPAIAVESCHLPGEIHGDPVDRIIIATSRVFNLPLITKDQNILNYAAQNYLKAV